MPAAHHTRDDADAIARFILEDADIDPVSVTYSDPTASAWYVTSAVDGMHVGIIVPERGTIQGYPLWLMNQLRDAGLTS